MTDAEMIQRPNEWPRWPLLPLVHRKRKARLADCGFLLEEDAPPYKVYIGYIFSLRSDVPLGEAVKDLLVEEYPTVEALIADWRVD